MPRCVSPELYCNDTECHVDALGKYGQRSLLTAGTPNSANTGDVCSETGTWTLSRPTETTMCQPQDKAELTC